MPKHAARATPRLKALRKNRKVMNESLEDLLKHGLPTSSQTSTCPKELKCLTVDIQREVCLSSTSVLPQASEAKLNLDSTDGLLTKDANEMQRTCARIESARNPLNENNTEYDHTGVGNTKQNSTTVLNEEETPDKRNQYASGSSSSAGNAQNDHRFASSHHSKSEVARGQQQTPANSPRKAEDGRGSEVHATENVKIENATPEFSFLDIESWFNSPLQSFYNSTPAQVVNAASHPTVMLHPGALQFLAENHHHSGTKHDDENPLDPFIGEVFYHTPAEKSQPNDAIKELNRSTQPPSKMGCEASSSKTTSGTRKSASDFLLENTTESATIDVPKTITTNSEVPVVSHLSRNDSLFSLAKPGGSSSTSKATNLRVQEVESKTARKEDVSHCGDVPDAEIPTLDADREIEDYLIKLKSPSTSFPSLPAPCSPKLEQLPLAKGKRNRTRQKKSVQNENIVKVDQGPVSKALKKSTNIQKQCINNDSFSSKCFPNASDFCVVGKCENKKFNIDLGLENDDKSLSEAASTNMLNSRISSSRKGGALTMKVSHPINDPQYGNECTKQRQDSTGLDEKLRDISYFQRPEDETADGELKGQFRVNKLSDVSLAQSSSDTQFLERDRSLLSSEIKLSREEGIKSEFPEVKGQKKQNRVTQLRLKKSTTQTRVKKELSVAKKISFNEDSRKIFPALNDAPSNCEDSYQDSVLKNSSISHKQVSCESQVTAAESPFSETPVKKCTSTNDLNDLVKSSKAKKPKNVQSSVTKSCANVLEGCSSDTIAHEGNETSTKRKRNTNVKTCKVKKSKIVRGTDQETEIVDDEKENDFTETNPDSDEYSTLLASGRKIRAIKEGKTQLRSVLKENPPTPSEIAPQPLSPPLKQKRSRASYKLPGKNNKSVASVKITTLTAPTLTRNCNLPTLDISLDPIETQCNNPESCTQRHVQDTNQPVGKTDGQIDKISEKSTSEIKTNRFLSSSPTHSRPFSYFSGSFGGPAPARANKSDATGASLTSSTEGSSLFGKNESLQSQLKSREDIGEDIVFERKCRKIEQKQNLSFQDLRTQVTQNATCSFTEFRSVPVNIFGTSKILENKSNTFRKKAYYYKTPDSLKIADMNINDCSPVSDVSNPPKGLSTRNKVFSGENSKILHAPYLNIVKFPGAFASKHANCTVDNNKTSSSFDSTRKTSVEKFKCCTHTLRASDEREDAELDQITLKANMELGNERKAPTSCASAIFGGSSQASQTVIPNSGPFTFGNEVGKVEVPFGSGETEQSDAHETNTDSVATTHREVKRASLQRSICAPGQVDSQGEILKINEREYRVLPAKLLLPLYDPLKFLSKVPPQPLILTLKREGKTGKSDGSFDITDYDIHQMG